ncbi:hypothetical protein DCO58_02205 [Helicobacter saguini]|uniref:Uncharacterized protein n=1 Tax=Helicobacter saguini TaxID=1548018 RepID=A0A347VRQ9_9HELI|nr:hypothetical protein [Helicobacter saguini]MWV62811.1 hypothetical protein [Helicobacter saguini]MWV66520.1 hypothetical protein [Helicobacter saguini]MWV68869.1 hypothetical protein [Helicobacter saguini]MWV71576.1 hypothetical protein [Helicobacter saguini]TLD93667.1 hypothetical protein LS64_008565 [Helicobacter saguini]
MDKIQSLLNEIATICRNEKAKKEAKIAKYGKSVILSDNETYEYIEKKRLKREAIKENVIAKYYRDFCNE